MSTIAERVADRLTKARASTLRFVGDLDDRDLCAQPDPDFSPIGWHLGHVGYTEAHWFLSHLGGDASLVAPFTRTWAQGGCEKDERKSQPPRDAIFTYLKNVRARVLELLPALDWQGDDPLLRDGFIGWMLEAHEHQHRETMAIVRQLTLERTQSIAPPPPPCLEDARTAEWIDFPGGLVPIGSDERLAYDNERAMHEVALEPFSIRTTAATVGEWESFRAADGYSRRDLWSAEGWAWREKNDVRWPRGLTSNDEGRLSRPRLNGVLTPLERLEPMLGISFYEAEAFARFCEARLPTEAEWEHAARSMHTSSPRLALATAGPEPVSSPDFIGNVWEWTSTLFAPYPHFVAFPYRGYSEPYFDGIHRVMRGGSFATDPCIARPTFRNWYQPWMRQLFVGVRCTRSHDRWHP